MSEIYNGRRIATKADRRNGRTGSYINGVLLGFAYGTSEGVLTSELRTLRSWIDMADERLDSDPTAFPAHFYALVG